jgi:hypothetical protein
MSTGRSQLAKGVTCYLPRWTGAEYFLISCSRILESSPNSSGAISVDPAVLQLCTMTYSRLR